MSEFSVDRGPVFKSLDKVIIEAVRREQFMTCREIWITLQRDHSNVAPSLVYRRANYLVALGALGCIEKTLDGAILRRYYSFENILSSPRDRYSFIKN